jgi:hypothetical protein
MKGVVDVGCARTDESVWSEKKRERSIGMKRQEDDVFSLSQLIKFESAHQIWIIPAWSVLLAGRASLGSGRRFRIYDYEQGHWKRLCGF